MFVMVRMMLSLHPRYFTFKVGNVVPADILRAVLSLYLQDGGQNLPLPRTDEVLLCTELTTEEEVSAIDNYQ